MKTGARAVFAVLVAIIVTLWAQVALGAGQDKITICHHTSSETNPTVTITIAMPAYEAHVRNHGDGEFDTEGECPVEETTTTTQPEVTTTTVVEETTTTTVQETTTTTSPAPEQPTTTTTSLPFDEVGPTTTTAPPVVTSSTVVERTELPYTGLNPAVWLLIAFVSAVLGGVALAYSRKVGK